MDDRAIIRNGVNDVLVRAILLRSDCFKGTNLRRVLFQFIRLLVVNAFLEILGSAGGILRGLLWLEVAATLRCSHLSCYFSFFEGNLV